MEVGRGAGGGRGWSHACVHAAAGFLHAVACVQLELLFSCGYRKRGARREGDQCLAASRVGRSGWKGMDLRSEEKRREGKGLRADMKDQGQRSGLGLAGLDVITLRGGSKMGMTDRQSEQASSLQHRAARARGGWKADGPPLSTHRLCVSWASGQRYITGGSTRLVLLSYCLISVEGHAAFSRSIRDSPAS